MAIPQNVKPASIGSRLSAYAVPPRPHCQSNGRHTLLHSTIDLYALQPTVQHLTRSSLHRLQRHGISRLPDAEGGKPSKKFKAYPIGYFHIDMAELQAAKGMLYLASQSIAPVRLCAAGQKDGKDLSLELSRSSDRGRPLEDPQGVHRQWDPVHLPARYADGYVRFAIPGKRERTSADQDQATLDQWPARAHEPHDQGSDRRTQPLRSTTISSKLTLPTLSLLTIASGAEDPEGPPTLRINLQKPDFPAKAIQIQPAPANAGTNT